MTQSSHLPLQQRPLINELMELVSLPLLQGLVLICSLSPFVPQFSLTSISVWIDTSKKIIYYVQLLNFSVDSLRHVCTKRLICPKVLL